MKSRLKDVNFYYSEKLSALENCVNGGSVAYNALQNGFRTNDPLCASLDNHGVAQKYAWVRTIGENIISHSLIWYDSEQEWKSVGLLQNSTFGSVLRVYSVCRCDTRPPTSEKMYNICNKCISDWSPRRRILCYGNDVIALPELFDYFSTSEDMVGWMVTSSCLHNSKYDILARKKCEN